VGSERKKDDPAAEDFPLRFPEETFANSLEISNTNVVIFTIFNTSISSDRSSTFVPLANWNCYVGHLRGE
jgi:hypothetical protein